MILVVIVILVFVFLIVMVSPSPDPSKKMKEKADKFRKDLLQSVPDKFNKIIIPKGNGYGWRILAFDDTDMKFIYAETAKTPYTCSYSQIIEFEITNGDKIVYRETTSKYSTGGVVGRTIVGGVLLGGVGAFLGATTAQRKEQTEENTFEYEIRIMIIFKDPHQDNISFDVSRLWDNMDGNINKIKDKLSKIIASNHYEQPNLNTSTADELYKLFELKEKRAITEAEYDILKEQILNPNKS